MKNDSHQFDLFQKRERGESREVEVAPHFAAADFDSLDDEDVLTQLPLATRADVQSLCDVVSKRNLGDRTLPALDLLWRRFSGFGQKRLLIEQKAVLDTLVKLDTEQAHARLAGIVSGQDFPQPLLVATLRACRQASVKLPKSFVHSLLTHCEPHVRELAVFLSKIAGPDLAGIKGRLGDREHAVRIAAAIVTGALGYTGAKAILLSELQRWPTTEVIEALCGMDDEDIAVHLGRCADSHPAFAEIIITGLEDMETAMSMKIARRIRTNLQQDDDC